MSAAFPLEKRELIEKETLVFSDWSK